jgi:hypothetical protein
VMTNTDTVGTPPQEYVEPMEATQRLMMRRRQKTINVRVPPVVDKSQLMPVDFQALDRASLPPGTIQACIIVAVKLAEFATSTGLAGPASGMWVWPDGRFVAIAQDKGGQLRAMEEVWPDTPAVVPPTTMIK